MLGPTLILRLVLAVIGCGCVASVTFTVNAKVPTCVGAPLSLPVRAFSVIPGGRWPLLTRHASGAIPIAAVSACEWAVPILPFASVAVVIVSWRGAIVIVTGSLAATAVGWRAHAGADGALGGGVPPLARRRAAARAGPLLVTMVARGWGRAGRRTGGRPAAGGDTRSMGRGCATPTRPGPTSRRLPFFPALDQHGPASRIKIGLGERKGLTDPQPGAPQHHDDRA